MDKISKKHIIIVSYIISSIGDWIFKFSIPLYMYHLTGRAIDIAIGYALTFLPFLFFSLPAGVLADRMQKRKVLYILDIVGVFLCLGLYLLMTYESQIILIYLFVFMLSSVNTVYHVVFQGSLPLLFDAKDLPIVNSSISSSDSILSSLAPILGASIGVFFGYSYAILFNGMSFLISAILIILFVKFTSQQLGNKKILTMVKEGLVLSWQEKFVRFGAVLFFMGNLSLYLFFGIFVYYLKNNVKLGDMEVALIYALGGAMSVVGSFLAHKFVKIVGTAQKFIAISVLLSGLFIIPISIPNIYVIAFSWVIISLLSSMNVVIYFTERQKRVSKDILSRVVAISRLVAYAAIPLGAVLGGYLVSKTSVAVVIIIAGIYRILVGVWGIIQSKKF